MGFLHLLAICSRSFSSLSSRAMLTCSAAAYSGKAAMQVLYQVLFPAQQTLTSPNSTLTLRPTNKVSKGRVIDIHVFNVQLFYFLAVRFDLCQGFFDVLSHDAPSMQMTTPHFPCA